jgi:hypothetical protein
MEPQRRKRPPLSERLRKGLKEANEWTRGERELRVTRVTLPDEPTEPIAGAERLPHESASQ